MIAFGNGRKGIQDQVLLCVGPVNIVIATETVAIWASCGLVVARGASFVMQTSTIHAAFIDNTSSIDHTIARHL